MQTEEKQQTPINRTSEGTIDLHKIITILLRSWYYIVGAVIICMVIANLLLRYSKPLYVANLSMKLEDEKPNQINDFFKFGKASGKLENFLRTETEILKSRTYAAKVLNRLHYDVTYIVKGKIITSELYPNNIFNIDFVYLDSTNIGRQYEINFLNMEKFELYHANDKKTKSVFNLNDTVFFDGSFFVISIKKKNYYTAYLNIPITYYINDHLGQAASFSSGLGVEIEKGTNILNLSYTSEVPQLASDYLNAIAAFYIEESINNKSQAIQQTVQFIDAQLDDLAEKVKSSQGDLADFKTNNNGIELDEIGHKELETLTKLDEEKLFLQLRLRMLEQTEKNVLEAQNKPVDLMTFDSEDKQNLPDLFGILNTLIMERLALTSKYTANSPLLLENEKKLNEIKKAIAKNISSLRDKTIAKINYNNKLIEEVNSHLTRLPGKQQTLINLQRESKVNEKVYSYLLEKKLETLISKSSIVSNASVIDASLVPQSPISPDSKKTYTVAFLIGIFIGTSLILVTRLLYQKIPDKETIESLSRTPVIGVIKKVNTAAENAGYDVHVFKSPKSVFSESIRGIRTNMNFILKGGKHKSICITSTVSGEGKTFCTINLAASLTMLNYKVIIVGCDLRRPKLHLSFKDISNDIGLSTYLIGKHTLQEIIHHTEYENLYVLPAGPTPPNPAELLQTDEMNQLFLTLQEEYDFVLYDTAPVGLVSDSFPLMKQADLNIFIIRAQYSKRDFATIPDKLSADNNISNIYTILNSYDTSSVIYSSIYKSDYAGYYGGGYYYYGSGYGGGSYGYYGRKYYSSYYSGYYTEDEVEAPWWKFWQKKRKRK